MFSRVDMTTIHRTIDVRAQRHLTFRQTVLLCLRGIRHRLLRSVMTLCVAALAVAFFMFLMTENTLVGSIAVQVHREVLDARMPANWLARLKTRPAPAGHAKRLADYWRTSSPLLEEAASVTGIPLDEVNNLARSAANEHAYLVFMRELPLGKRLILFERREGRAALRYLLDDNALEAFGEKVAGMHGIRIPGTLEGFTEFLSGYALYSKQLADFTRAWNGQVELLQQGEESLTQGVPLNEWLVSAADAEVAGWRDQVNALGFALSGEDLPVIRRYLKDTRLKQQVVERLNDPELVDQWRKIFRSSKRISTDEKLLVLDDPRAAEVLKGEFSAKELEQLKDRQSHDRDLHDFETALAGKVVTRDGKPVMGTRQLFLLGISFLVCMVGISNAMLMSITERFREIATMKCLGATDRFILVQFMTEAGLQGLAGGICGVILGLLAAVVKTLGTFGLYTLAHWPGTQILAGAGLSVLAGILLAVLASTYPSLAASRMAPMEAMRIE